MLRLTWLRCRTNISAIVFPSFDKGYTRDTYRFLVYFNRSSSLLDLYNFFLGYWL